MTISLRSDAGGTSGAIQVGSTDVLAMTASGSMTVPAVTGMFRNLKASASGLTSSVLVSADEIVVSGASSYKALASVSLSLSTASSGANGLDSGAVAMSTWYSVWVIWNGSTVAGLLSLSETAPTMPSGYTHKARVGWIRTDGTANKYPLNFTQYGKRSAYRPVAGTNVTAYPSLASGTSGAVTTAIPLAAFVPPTASQIRVTFGTPVISATSTAFCFGPNAATAANNANTDYAFVAPGPAQYAQTGAMDVQLETMNLYYWSNSAGGFLRAAGWEDNL